MMSRTQLRMARAALGWTLKDLAERAGINLNTISRYETGGSMLSDTLERIEIVLRAEGIGFVDEDEHYGPGIRGPKAATGGSLAKAKRRPRSAKTVKPKR
jgi:transcriptional regulator with XRE-family HTH domain